MRMLVTRFCTLLLEFEVSIVAGKGMTLAQSSQAGHGRTAATSPTQPATHKAKCHSQSVVRVLSFCGDRDAANILDKKHR